MGSSPGLARARGRAGGPKHHYNAPITRPPRTRKRSTPAASSTGGGIAGLAGVAGGAGARRARPPSRRPGPERRRGSARRSRRRGPRVRARPRSRSPSERQRTAARATRGRVFVVATERAGGVERFGSFQDAVAIDVIRREAPAYVSARVSVAAGPTVCRTSPRDGAHVLAAAQPLDLARQRPRVGVAAQI